jgi:hypothetical protein
LLADLSITGVQVLLMGRVSLSWLEWFSDISVRMTLDTTVYWDHVSTRMIIHDVAWRTPLECWLVYSKLYAFSDLFLVVVLLILFLGRTYFLNIDFVHFKFVEYNQNNLHCHQVICYHSVPYIEWCWCHSHLTSSCICHIIYYQL